MNQFDKIVPNRLHQLQKVLPLFCAGILLQAAQQLKLLPDADHLADAPRVAGNLQALLVVQHPQRLADIALCKLCRLLPALSRKVPRKLLQRLQALGNGAYRQRDHRCTGQNRGQNPRSIVAGEDEQHLCRRLLDDLEQGVLGLLGHIVDVAQNVHLILPVVWTDIGVGAQRADLVDMKSPGFVLRLLEMDVRVRVGQNQAAVPAPAAGTLGNILLPAQNTCRHHPRKCGFTASVLPSQQDSMRQTPVS